MNQPLINFSRRRHLKTSAKMLGFILFFGEAEIAWGAKI
jgi:N-acetylmuramoyl-L-alanine amidase